MSLSDRQLASLSKRLNAVEYKISRLQDAEADWLIAYISSIQQLLYFIRTEGADFILVGDGNGDARDMRDASGIAMSANNTQTLADVLHSHTVIIQELTSLSWRMVPDYATPLNGGSGDTALNKTSPAGAMPMLQVPQLIDSGAGGYVPGSHSTWQFGGMETAMHSYAPYHMMGISGAGLYSDGSPADVAYIANYKAMMQVLTGNGQLSTYQRAMKRMLTEEMATGAWVGGVNFSLFGADVDGTFNVTFLMSLQGPIEYYVAHADVPISTAFDGGTLPNLTVKLRVVTDFKKLCQLTYGQAIPADTATWVTASIASMTFGGISSGGSNGTVSQYLRVNAKIRLQGTFLSVTPYSVIQQQAGSETFGIDEAGRQLGFNGLGPWKISMSTGRFLVVGWGQNNITHRSITRPTFDWLPNYNFTSYDPPAGVVSTAASRLRDYDWIRHENAISNIDSVLSAMRAALSRSPESTLGTVAQVAFMGAMIPSPGISILCMMIAAGIQLYQANMAGSSLISASMGIVAAVGGLTGHLEIRGQADRALIQHVNDSLAYVQTERMKVGNMTTVEHMVLEFDLEGAEGAGAFFQAIGPLAENKGVQHVLGRSHWAPGHGVAVETNPAAGGNRLVVIRELEAPGLWRGISAEQGYFSIDALTGEFVAGSAGGRFASEEDALRMFDRIRRARGEEWRTVSKFQTAWTSEETQPYWDLFKKFKDGTLYSLMGNSCHFLAGEWVNIRQNWKFPFTIDRAELRAAHTSFIAARQGELAALGFGGADFKNGIDLMNHGQLPTVYPSMVDRMTDFDEPLRLRFNTNFYNTNVPFGAMDSVTSHQLF